MRVPGELYAVSARPYRGLPDLAYVISSLPVYVRRSMEVAARSCAKTLGTLTAFCLRQGVDLLLRLPDIDDIRVAREAVLRSGGEDIAWFDRWSYDVSPQHAGRQTLYGRVCPEDASEGAQLAHSLGLPASTVATLAIMATLIHLSIPDVSKQHMLDELVSFGRAVRTRARRARQLAKTAAGSTSPRLQARFQDVLDAVEQDD